MFKSKEQLFGAVGLDELVLYDLGMKKVAKIVFITRKVNAYWSIECNVMNQDLRAEGSKAGMTFKRPCIDFCFRVGLIECLGIAPPIKKCNDDCLYQYITNHHFDLMKSRYEDKFTVFLTEPWLEYFFSENIEVVSK